MSAGVRLIRDGGQRSIVTKGSGKEVYGRKISRFGLNAFTKQITKVPNLSKRIDYRLSKNAR
jgi:hypothetical protein